MVECQDSAGIVTPVCELSIPSLSSLDRDTDPTRVSRTVQGYRQPNEVRESQEG